MSTQTTTTFKGMSQTLGTYATQIRATLDGSGLDSATQNKLTAALTIAQDKVQQAIQVGPLVAQIVQTPNGAREMKLALANKAFARARDEATAALDALTSVGASIRQQIGRDLYAFTKPKGVDPDVLLMRRADVCDYLTKHEGSVLDNACDLLRESLARKDAEGDLTAYILTGTLDLWFRSRNILPAEYEQRLGEVVGSLRPEGRPAGLAVRALLGGGPNTLDGFISVAKVVIFDEMQAAQANLARAPYTVQHNPNFVYDGPTL